MTRAVWITLMFYLKNIDFPKSIFSAFVFIALITRERKTSGKAWSWSLIPHHSSWFCQSKESFVNYFPQRCLDLWLSPISSLSICSILLFSSCCTSVFLYYWIWGDYTCSVNWVHRVWISSILQRCSDECSPPCLQKIKWVITRRWQSSQLVFKHLGKTDSVQRHCE